MEHLYARALPAGPGMNVPREATLDLPIRRAVIRLWPGTGPSSVDVLQSFIRKSTFLIEYRICRRRLPEYLQQDFPPASCRPLAIKRIKSRIFPY